MQQLSLTHFGLVFGEVGPTCGAVLVAELNKAGGGCCVPACSVAAVQPSIPPSGCYRNQGELQSQ